MKQSAAPLIVTVEAGFLLGIRTQERPLVPGSDYLLLDLAKTFECTKCKLTWPMEAARLDEHERPVCPLCALKTA